MDSSCLCLSVKPGICGGRIWAEHNLGLLFWLQMWVLFHWIPAECEMHRRSYVKCYQPWFANFRQYDCTCILCGPTIGSWWLWFSTAEVFYLFLNTSVRWGVIGNVLKRLSPLQSVNCTLWQVQFVWLGRGQTCFNWLSSACVNFLLCMILLIVDVFLQKQLLPCIFYFTWNKLGFGTEMDVLHLELKKLSCIGTSITVVFNWLSSARVRFLLYMILLIVELFLQKLVAPFHFLLCLG